MNTENICIVGGGRKATRPLAASTLILALALFFGASQAFAQNGKGGGYYDTAGGGYSGPGPAIATVEQVKNMRDDARVALQGRIVQSLGGKNYAFADDSGVITVEISDKRWRGQDIGPDDLVEINGKVDKEWSKLEIEVKRIIKL